MRENKRMFGTDHDTVLGDQSWSGQPVKSIVCIMNRPSREVGQQMVRTMRWDGRDVLSPALTIPVGLTSAMLLPIERVKAGE